MDYVNDGRGLNVILTPGRYNSAFFEHSYLAEKSGAVLAFPGDLVVEDDKLYYYGLYNKKQPVGALYRRISDDYLDPMAFEASSMLGVPNLMQAYAKGNVALINTLGNGVADDKGTYYFVPMMIKYYLNEDPILQNAPTYLPYYKNDYDYILSNIEKLVIKDVSEAGGYGVVFGRDLSPEKLAELKALIIEQPRRWIAQEIIDFKDLELLDGDDVIERKADLRVFVVSGKETKVWKSGLTRFSRQEGSFVVNSSQGGGFKDTWVMNK
ncbi:MAG: circularly permuted type 2 ATP-grasp protein, partial [Rikenellaceae bacterium]